MLWAKKKRNGLVRFVFYLNKNRSKRDASMQHWHNGEAKMPRSLTWLESVVQVKSIVPFFQESLLFKGKKTKHFPENLKYFLDAAGATDPKKWYLSFLFHFYLIHREHFVLLKNEYNTHENHNFLWSRIFEFSASQWKRAENTARCVTEVCERATSDLKKIREMFLLFLTF